MTEKSENTLDDRLDGEFAEAWRPEAGEKLVGEVVELGERTGAYGPYPIITVRRDDGEEVAVHAFRTVLSQKLAEFRPKVGERIGLKYEGEVQGAARRYHSYKVAVDRAGQGVDWSTYADADESDSQADTAGPLNAPLGSVETDDSGELFPH